MFDFASSPGTEEAGAAMPQAADTEILDAYSHAVADAVGPGCGAWKRGMRTATEP